MKRIIVINLGSTSTKIAYFENDTCVSKKTIDHDADLIRTFPTIWDQKEFRMGIVRDFMQEVNVKPEELAASQLPTEDDFFTS